MRRPGEIFKSECVQTKTRTKFGFTEMPIDHGLGYTETTGDTESY